MPKIAKLFVIAASFAALSGCSSLMYGPYEKITVTSAPDNALCKIYRDGQGYVKSVATPDATYLMRDDKPITITCSKAGFKTTSVKVETTRGQQDNIANVSNAGAGFLVDLANATQDQLPDTVHVNMAAQ